MFTMRAGTITLSLACLLISAAPAGAAIRLGPDITRTPTAGFPTIACAQACTLVPGSAPTGDLTEAPSDGVVTEVRYRGEFSDTRVRLVRVDTAAKTVRVVRSGAPLTATALGVDQWKIAERIEIRAGERVTLDAPGSGAALFALPGLSGGLAVPRPADGAEAAYTAFPFSGPWIEAFVEPDADRDGFGDETQDRCPNDASTQAPCPVAPVRVEVPGPTVTETVLLPASSAAAPILGTPVLSRDRRTVTTPVTCAARCNGIVELRTAKAVKLGRTKAVVLLGSGRFAGAAGSAPVARVRLAAAARALLRPGAKLGVEVVLRPVDAAASSKRVTLRVPAKRKR
ncbi:MAG: hypothetical protein ACEQSX_09035 [Baekduiaceae bacterium]